MRTDTQMDSQIFQSTFPLQGTTLPVVLGLRAQNISIHVPIAGNDPSGESGYKHGGISIHVPIAGNDKRNSQKRPRKRHFNPRSHCRERRLGEKTNTVGGKISIHVPIAGNDFLKH